MLCHNFILCEVAHCGSAMHWLSIVGFRSKCGVEWGRGGGRGRGFSETNSSRHMGTVDQNE